MGDPTQTARIPTCLDCGIPMIVTPPVDNEWPRFALHRCPSCGHEEWDDLDDAFATSPVAS